MDKPELELLGTNGNAFAILGNAQRTARRAGWSKERIQKVMAEARSGDYDHLLRTMMDHFEVR